MVLEEPCVIQKSYIGWSYTRQGQAVIYLPPIKYNFLCKTTMLQKKNLTTLFLYFPQMSQINIKSTDHFVYELLLLHFGDIHNRIYSQLCVQRTTQCWSSNSLSTYSLLMSCIHRYSTYSLFILYVYLYISALCLYL